VQQRGSALLIVFLFAAVIAIMLYREMPTVAFESRRQTEQLLIDRGNEYKHAVKLYYRKVGGYPSSVSQLENTNRMRFLRHKFKDPFTDKDDWRLLHMGPGNMLLDSKVKKLQNNGAQAAVGAAATGKSSFGGSSSFGGNSTTASTSSFGNGSNSSSTFGSNMGGFTGLSSSDNQPPVKVPPVRQRGPEIPAGAGGTEDSDMSANTSADDAIPMPPEMPPAETPSASMPPAGQAAQPGVGSNGNQAGNNSQNPSNSMQMVQGLFNSQSSRQGMSTSSRTGTTQGGGGIAGVASKASGESIKEVNEQTDYSLWEFYYDPTKDVQPGLNGAAGGTATSVGTGVVSPPARPATATGFATQTSSFFNSGSNSSSGSSFGSGSSASSGNTSSSGQSSGSAQNTPRP
jgi:hypothetical protein